MAIDFNFLLIRVKEFKSIQFESGFTNRKKKVGCWKYIFFTFGARRTMYFLKHKTCTTLEKYFIFLSFVTQVVRAERYKHKTLENWKKKDVC